MKKFFMIAIMAVAALTANAQKGEVKFSAHAGAGYVNIANQEEPSLVGAGINDYSSAIGALLGAECEYMVSDKFGLSAGLDYLYAKTSEKSQEGIEGKFDDMYYDFSYLNIPVLAQLHMGKFAVKAGLQPGFLLSADYHENGKTKSQTSGLNSFNLSLPVGVSLDCGASTTLDLRCAIPLTKMNKNDMANGKDVKMTTIMLSLGYRF